MSTSCYWPDESNEYSYAVVKTFQQAIKETKGLRARPVGQNARERNANKECCAPSTTVDGGMLGIRECCDKTPCPI
ncbi:hypothetical protein SUGI_1488300 [Cryptomeria japonica]|uniref:Uncharacterized protein n=1 Tax=Cryptomeria japonica TaxID=3369 RepID=A0AAD3NTR7_CRYJA|nr:hypothetical protein SUGI_1373090 [Cryptomeria japonica]GLJ59007.1 hypothetical protein SUGI_1488300 [Cryptomeria japonica]